MVAGLAMPTLAYAEKPIVLLLTSDNTPRSTAIVDSFKAAMEGTTRITYSLGAERDAAAFLADNIRGMEVALVFAVGDRAFLAALREFTNTPVVYTDVLDPLPAAGRTNMLGGSPRVDPAATLQRLKTLFPRLQTVGTIRGTRIVDEFWNKSAEEAAGTLGIRLVDRTVANPAEVATAAKVLLADCGCIWPLPDPIIWAPTVVAHLIHDAMLAKVPVLGLEEAWLQAATPAPLVCVSSTTGIGTAAAARARSVLKLDSAGAASPYAGPWIVGSKATCRAFGVVLTKNTAPAVDQWID